MTTSPTPENPTTPRAADDASFSQYYKKEERPCNEKLAAPGDDGDGTILFLPPPPTAPRPACRICGAPDVFVDGKGGGGLRPWICNSWCCPDCEARLRQSWKEQAAWALSTLPTPDDGGPAWVHLVRLADRRAWERLSEGHLHRRRKAGDPVHSIRVLMPGTAVFAVMTVPPPDPLPAGVTHARTVPAWVALHRLGWIIDVMPPEKNRIRFSHEWSKAARSRAQKADAKRKGRRPMRRLGAAPDPVADVVAEIEARGGAIRPTPVPLEAATWVAWVFPDGDDSWHDVMADVLSGTLHPRRARLDTG